MLPRVPPGCSRVASYLWMEGEAIVAEVDALEYWPLSPGLVKEGNRSYIVCGDRYRDCSSPTHERIENGDVRPMPKSRWAGGGVYFNRSRRALPHA